MKILFTGAGSGGHFYPIIAVAQEIYTLVSQQKLLEPELYYVAPDPSDPRRLFELGIEYRKCTAGKIRRYFSLLNFLDLFKTGWGIVTALILLFRIYPDVVFSKGGYASFPVVLAAWILRIPVVVHESDAVPGKTNQWAGKIADYIAVAYPEAASFFPSDRVAHVGSPVRRELFKPAKEGASEFLNLEKDVPVIFILGGSQGAQLINDAILSALPQLVERYQIIHQTGKKQIDEIVATSKVVLAGNNLSHRYHPFDYLNDLSMRMAAGAAHVVVSRAGSTIFEIALWGVPSILIPITKSGGDHQRKNAYAYARTGAAVVMEERNLSPNLLVSEINRIINSPETREAMRNAATSFATPDAASKIANVLLKISLQHERH